MRVGGQCVGGTSIKVGSGCALVDQWQLCVSTDAVAHVNANTDDWSRGSRACQPTFLSCVRFICGRVSAFRLKLRSGFT